MLLEPQNNFMNEFTTEDFKAFKRRMVSAILSTDMAKHTEDLESFKRRLEITGVKSDLNNGSLFVDKSNGQKKFDSQ